jgi:DNA polymerase I-like protein with 3'-5' exonuclease and polymerase domains
MKQPKQVLGELPAHVSAPDPSIYWKGDYIVVDFETTTLYKGNPLVEGNKLVLASWYDSRDGSIKSTFGSEYSMDTLVADIQATSFCVAHNAKFELGWLRRCGLDLRNTVSFDTLIAEWVLGGNKYRQQQLSLNQCLERRGMEQKIDIISKMIKGGACPSEIPESWLQEYCERDVEACHALFLAMREELRELGLEAVNYLRNLVTPCLADIEFNGLQLDEGPVDELATTMDDEYARVTSRLQDFCEGAEPSSTDQMRTYIFDTLGFAVPKDHKGRPYETAGGVPSIAAPVVEQLRPRNAKQKEFLAKFFEWREYHSDVTKYLRKFRDCCREVGGRLRGAINQGATKTHRFSSSGLEYKVQFQNLNRRFKPLFRARNDGWLVGEADGAQLEFRVAAHLGRDRVALRDIVEGRDVHSFTASIIGCSRQDAKAHTFKPLYGGVSGTPEEREYYDAFKERYSTISTTQRHWALKVLDSKILDTEWGMKYYFPYAKLKESGWITGQTNIYNYPVQAFATAEIIPIVLVAMWHRSKDMQSFIVNTVHDSVIMELHPDEVEMFHELARQCFIGDTYSIISALYSIDITVPLGTGVMVGTHWGNKEAKQSEVVYEAPAEYWEPAAKKEGMI